MLYSYEVEGEREKEREIFYLIKCKDIIFTIPFNGLIRWILLGYHVFFSSSSFLGSFYL